jgi:hypothetical protein
MSVLFYILMAMTVASGLLMYNEANFDYDRYRYHSDPTIPLPKAIIDYIPEKNIVIVDEAREWSNYFESSLQIHILKWVVKISTVGRGQLVYAPYFGFQTAIQDDCKEDCIVSIRFYKNKSQALLIQTQHVIDHCNLNHARVTGHVGHCKARLGNTQNYHVDSYYLDIGGNTKSYTNRSGSHCGSASEIATWKFFTACLVLLSGYIFFQIVKYLSMAFVFVGYFLYLMKKALQR